MSKPIAVPARPGPSHAPLLASADGTAPSRPVSLRPACCGVSWSQRWSHPGAPPQGSAVASLADRGSPEPERATKPDSAAHVAADLSPVLACFHGRGCCAERSDLYVRTVVGKLNRTWPLAGERAWPKATSVVRVRGRRPGGSEVSPAAAAGQRPGRP